MNHPFAGDLAIATTALTKRFGRQTAVDSLDLAVPRGSVFGFLGPNGSGKTTTIRMLLGLAAATSGDIRLLGGDMPRAAAYVLPSVGALVEGPAFYPFLSGRANLERFDSADRFAVSATRRARVDAALDRVGLSHAARKPAHAYSLGMKQRLGIAVALLTPRDLLVLDEPSNGLDPQGTREIRGLIRSLADDGRTIFVSSHLLSEVELMCTHIAVMSAGRLVAQGTLDDLRSRGSARVRLLTPDADAARQVLRGLGLDPADAPHPVSRTSDASDHTASDHAASGHTVTADIRSGNASTPELPVDVITAALVAAGVRVRGIALEGTSLEDRFVELTGEGFDVAG